MKTNRSAGDADASASPIRTSQQATALWVGRAPELTFPPRLFDASRHIESIVCAQDVLPVTNSITGTAQIDWHPSRIARQTLPPELLGGPMQFEYDGAPAAGLQRINPAGLRPASGRDDGRGPRSLNLVWRVPAPPGAPLRNGRPYSHSSPGLSVLFDHPSQARLFGLSPSKIPETSDASLPATSRR